MTAGTWVVAEYNQASGQLEEVYGPFRDMGGAYEDAVQRAIDTALVHRREMYRVARLEFVTDFVEIPEEARP